MNSHNIDLILKNRTDNVLARQIEFHRHFDTYSYALSGVASIWTPPHSFHHGSDWNSWGGIKSNKRISKTPDPITAAGRKGSRDFRDW
jgi:hypothetical protein